MLCSLLTYLSPPCSPPVDAETEDTALPSNAFSSASTSAVGEDAPTDVKHCSAVDDRDLLRDFGRDFADAAIMAECLHARGPSGD